MVLPNSTKISSFSMTPCSVEVEAVEEPLSLLQPYKGAATIARTKKLAKSFFKLPFIFILL